MLKQRNQTVIRIVFAAAAVWSMPWGNASAALTFNGTHENGRYLNGRYLNGASINGIMTNGVAARDPNIVHIPEADTGLRPSAPCLSEPDQCGFESPRARPSGATVRSITLPDGTSVTVE
jgi:hypothetical protein